MTTIREELIEELECKLSNPTSPDEIAEFILNDRIATLEGIKPKSDNEFMDCQCGNFYEKRIEKAIAEIKKEQR